MKINDIKKELLATSKVELNRLKNRRESKWLLLFIMINIFDQTTLALKFLVNFPLFLPIIKEIYNGGFLVQHFSNIIRSMITSLLSNYKTLRWELWLIPTFSKVVRADSFKDSWQLCVWNSIIFPTFSGDFQGISWLKRIPINFYASDLAFKILLI